jgi:hypothetical protein
MADVSLNSVNSGSGSGSGSGNPNKRPLNDSNDNPSKRPNIEAPPMVDTIRVEVSKVISNDSLH